VIISNTPAPDVSSFNLISSASICKNSPSTVTITSSTLGNGTYMVVYNTSGANNSVGDTASLVMNNDTGSFVTDAMTATGPETVTVTYIASGLGCYTQLNSSNTVTFNVIGFSLTATAVANVACRGENEGIAAASVSGGIEPYTYFWSPGSQTTDTATGLSAGTYTVTVQDSLGACSETASVTITQPSTGLAVRAGAINEVSCNGSSDGRANADVYGGVSPYTYSWSNGSSIASTNNPTGKVLSAGVYTVTVTDMNGCSATAMTIISQPNPMRDSVKAITNVECNGGNGGTATIGGKGGNYPYNFVWSTGSTLATATGLSAGTYSVIITDQMGCTNTVTGITITQASAIRDSVASAAYPSCNGGMGSATIGVTGGAMPYTYTWTGGVSTTATASNITSRTYTVTIKDANSCSSTLVFTLTQPVAIRDTIVSSDKVNVSCNGGNNGSATVGVRYGTSPYSFAWSPNVSSTASATGLSAGVYSITVTDSNGCSSSVAKLTIEQPGILRDSISGHSCSDDLIRATVGVKGGTTPYTYAWSPGGGTKATMSNLSAGTYTIVVTDKNNCSVTITPALSCSEISHEGQDENNSAPQCCAGSENITLYPNPSNGQFTLSGLQQGALVEMFDYTGRNISTISASDITMQLNVSDQPNGIYLIRILDKDRNLVSQKKVVKTN